MHCATEHLPLAVILCDIDDFKRYNDLYGHLQGDQSLREVAQTLKRAANKKSDLVARFGGEEFVILLPETTLLDAIAVAERICTTVEALHIEHEHSHVSQWVTVSLGVAALTPSKEFTSEMLLHAADTALYRAKTAGRNRVASGAISSGLF
jgi:diguanylate cyclase (GGDEF)-like protein